MMLNGCSGSIDNPRGLPLRLATEITNSPLVSNIIPYRDPTTGELLMLEVVFGEEALEKFIQVRRMSNWVPLKRFNILINTVSEVSHLNIYMNSFEVFERSDDSIYVFYSVKDSTCINLYAIELNSGKTELLYVRTRPNSFETQAVWDASMSGPYFIENAESDITLIWTNLYTAFHPDPRSFQVLDRIWPYTVRFRLINGAALNTLTMCDIDVDEKIEILFSSNAPCDGHDEGLMGGSRCWYAAYTWEGENKWATPLRPGGGSAILRTLMIDSRHLLGIHRLTALDKEAGRSFLHELDPLTGEIIREQEVQGVAYWSDFVKEDTSRIFIVVDPLHETVRYHTLAFQSYGKEKQIEHIKSFRGLIHPWGSDEDTLLQFGLKMDVQL